MILMDLVCLFFVSIAYLDPAVLHIYLHVR